MASEDGLRCSINNCHCRHAEDVLDSVLPMLGFKPAPSGFDLNGDGRIDFEDFRACAPRDRRSAFVTCWKACQCTPV